MLRATASLAAIRRESAERQAMAAALPPAGSFVGKPEAFTVTGPTPEAVRYSLGGAANRAETRHALELKADVLEQQPVVASAVI